MNKKKIMIDAQTELKEFDNKVKLVKRGKSENSFYFLLNNEIKKILKYKIGKINNYNEKFFFDCKILESKNNKFLVVKLR